MRKAVAEYQSIIILLNVEAENPLQLNVERSFKTFKSKLHLSRPSEAGAAPSLDTYFAGF